PAPTRTLRFGERTCACGLAPRRYQRGRWRWGQLRCDGACDDALAFDGRMFVDVMMQPDRRSSGGFGEGWRRIDVSGADPPGHFAETPTPGRSIVFLRPSEGRVPDIVVDFGQIRNQDNRQARAVGAHFRGELPQDGFRECPLEAFALAEVAV